LDGRSGFLSDVRLIRKRISRPDSGMPVAGFAAVVSECENPDGVGRLEVCDVVGKIAHRCFAGRYVGRNTRNSRRCLRPSGNSLERRINCFEELKAEPRSSAFVPDGRLFKLGGGFKLGSEGAVHWSANRRATRARTSSHGSPTDSPAITRRARPSISRAHAASTAAASVVAGSSRLARSSAATPARSSTGRVNASRSSACARSVTPSFYTRVMWADTASWSARLALALTRDRHSGCVGL
jgi:hypothetical protein